MRGVRRKPLDQLRSRAYIIAREPTSAPQISICGLRADPRGSVATAAESMRDVFDIYTIIFLALAVFIFLRLRSVLGPAHRPRAAAL